MQAKDRPDRKHFDCEVFPHCRDPLLSMLVMLGMPKTLGYLMRYDGSLLAPDQDKYHKYIVEHYALSSLEVGKRFETKTIANGPQFDSNDEPDLDAEWIVYYVVARRLYIKRPDDDGAIDRAWGVTYTPICYEEMYNYQKAKFEIYISRLEDVKLFERESHTALLMAGVALVDLMGGNFNARKGYSREEITELLYGAVDRYARSFLERGEALPEEVNLSVFTSQHLNLSRSAINYYFGKHVGLKDDFAARWEYVKSCPSAAFREVGK